MIEDQDEVASEAIQLFAVATFNGLCRLISALAENGFIEQEQLGRIHDAMTAPLNDPDWRDDSFVANTRDVLDRLLAASIIVSQR